VGGYFELLFLLVGVGRLGSIWLVNFVQMCVNIMSKQKQREKRGKNEKNEHKVRNITIAIKSE
jgi:hypothetical protein